MGPISSNIPHAHFPLNFLPFISFILIYPSTYSLTHSLIVISCYSRVSVLSLLLRQTKVKIGLSIIKFEHCSFFFYGFRVQSHTYINKFLPLVIYKRNLYMRTCYVRDLEWTSYKVNMWAFTINYLAYITMRIKPTYSSPKFIVRDRLWNQNFLVLVICFLILLCR